MMTTIETSEIPVVFDCQQSSLVGVVHVPPSPTSGLVLVAGGDQYRVGSHRLFVELARELAQAGVAVMRFDHRGVGDAKGPFNGFENLDVDIRAAISELRQLCPEIENLTLGGLCDGASAILIAAEKIPEVDNLILINPWVHTSDLEARTRLKNYYLARLTSKDFWKKLFKGQIDFSESLASLGGYISLFFQSMLQFGKRNSRPQDYVTRMRSGAVKFSGSLLVVLSGHDLVAQQFRQLVTIDKQWDRALKRDEVSFVHLDEADHTFSINQQRLEFEKSLTDWFRNR